MRVDLHMPSNVLIRSLAISQRRRCISAVGASTMKLIANAFIPPSLQDLGLSIVDRTVWDIGAEAPANALYSTANGIAYTLKRYGTETESPDVMIETEIEIRNDPLGAEGGIGGMASVPTNMPPSVFREAGVL